jgi:hypothetical protein
MSDLPVQGLLQQLNARPVSGEHLEVLGKHASDLWQSGRCDTLNEAVVATVKHAGLSPEQVRRVVEFTNTHAYLTEFKKEGQHKVIDFGPGGPADASDILKDLNDGGGGSVYDRGTLDYRDPPKETKIASVRAERELVELFGSDAALPYENPLGEAMDVRDKLAAANDHLLAQVSGLEVMYADLSDRVYHQLKQASLAGVPLSDVLVAWQTVSPGDDYIKVAFQLFSPRLLREGVFGSLEQMTGSVDKLASVGIVNTDHPLVGEFGEFCEVLQKLAEARAAREEVRVALDQMTGFLKEAGGIYGKAKEIAGKAAGPASKAVGKAVRVLAGEDAARTAEGVAHFGVKHAPTAAVLAGANEVRRRMQYGPVGRQVSDAVLKHVPMTPQYQQHNYEIATGQ